jgi:hypothetical protein
MTEHRIDILINRIVDKIETTEEWAEFRSLAVTEPSAWELLAEAQRDNDRLQALAHEATSIADLVEVPPSELPARSLSLRRSFSSGLGWAVAAAVLVAWVTSGPFSPLGTPHRDGRGGDRIQNASLLDTDGAWDNYLDRGKKEGTIVGEIEPKMLVDSKELPDGKLEVTFVRQVIERRVVPILIRPGVDDQGRVTPIRVRAASRGSL